MFPLRRFSLLVLVIGLMSKSPSVVTAADESGAVVLSEFLFEKAPFASCHASTITMSGSGLVAAWFGGPYEKHPDVGIWVARREEKGWTAPVEVADGVQYVDGEGRVHRHPCWNPVLFQPQEGPLMLFYKCGPDPRTWWGMMMVSDDSGRTWSRPTRLPERIDGPVKNKPIQLRTGEILSGCSTENAEWRVHLEKTSDLGKTWQRIGPINDGKEFEAIQPSILTYKDGRMQILCRTRQKKIAQSWSSDGGATWSRMTATELPNPNSGTDAVTLADGRQLLVYNHTVRSGPSPRGREMLNVAVSEDGEQWSAALTLENEKGEFSYPAVIQTPDGLVHTVYTWNRRNIRHFVLDPAKFQLRKIVNGAWPQ
ncbi:MAG: exo-alpha-sialidase [Planctomycetaceae bacterium]